MRQVGETLWGERKPQIYQNVNGRGLCPRRITEGKWNWAEVRRRAQPGYAQSTLGIFAE